MPSAALTAPLAPPASSPRARPVSRPWSASTARSAGWRRASPWCSTTATRSSAEGSWRGRAGHGRNRSETIAFRKLRVHPLPMPSAPDALAPEAPPEADPRRWIVLAVMCLSLLLIVMDNTIVNVAIPTLQKDLGASTSQLQWVVDAYVLVFAGLLLTMGSLGDRFGRRGALALGLAIMGSASILSAFAGSANQLIATRAIM